MPHATLTRESVASHNTPEDLWCIIDHKVYDLSDFVDAHPGGSVVLGQVAGQDATTAFTTSTDKKSWKNTANYASVQLRERSRKLLSISRAT
ncbi:hypothetical protein P3342_008147 [Pyrenophora teres f. teres]|nr:hypothetical protein P3342_008147 [Pyrenophora teres f. teres]